MARFVNIHAAKTHLSRLVEDAASGEEITLAKAGKPIARLVPCRPANGSRVLAARGMFRGKVLVSPDFDEPMPEAFWLGEQSL
ncbi:MAG: type II toxin-antitoxin system prevent-host-death family antitoxin [Bryobacter sp.]|jgi:prevent-host-death family protein|nr:type II toxin-antitoxin system prevent-host-death family antitoxin [Bryobacter sp.]